jgi:hypothetical protein
MCPTQTARYKTKDGDATTDVVCTECPVGSFCQAGKATKEECPAGTYQNAKGQGSCVDCGHDSHQGDGGQTYCVGITAGYYGKGGSDTTHTESVECPVGNKCVGGSTDLEPCPAGWYQDETRQTTCKRCDSSAGVLNGGFTAIKGQAKCANCQEGYFRNSDATGELPCPAGSKCYFDQNSEERPVGFCAVATECPPVRVCPLSRC